MVEVIWPIAGLATPDARAAEDNWEFGTLKHGWFRKLVASKRSSRPALSRFGVLNVLASDKSTVDKPGPRSVFLPSFPKVLVYSRA